MNSPQTISKADVQLLRRGLALGNAAVVDTVRSEGVRVQIPDAGDWFDTRPMLDPREHSPQVTDMAAEALSYGEAAGLLCRHSVHRHLVRVVFEG